MSTGHRVAMLGTGLIGDFYTMTLHGQRGRDRVEVVYSRSEERGAAFRERWDVPVSTTGIEEAVGHFQRAVEAKSLQKRTRVRNLHANLADCLARLGREPEAEREFRAEIEAIPTSESGREPSERALRTQSRVHPREVPIVTQHAEVRDATFLGTQIAHADRQVDDGRPGTDEVHENLDVEWHPLPAHAHGAYGGQRVDPEADHRVTHLGAASSLERDPERREAAGEAPSQSGVHRIVV